MLDVGIFYKDGARAYYDHVVQITHTGGDNVVIDFITDFNDHLQKSISADEIASMRVKIYG